MVAAVYAAHMIRSPKEVSVGAEGPAADRIFMKAGGRASMPRMPGIEGTPYLINSTILDREFIPRRLIIIGGGLIGVEFAQMFWRSGGEVTIIGIAPRLAAREDGDVSIALREIIEGEGINLRLNAKCIGFWRHGEELLARVDCAGVDREVSGLHLPVAVGRRSNTDDLGLARAGVARLREVQPLSDGADVSLWRTQQWEAWA